MTLNMGSSTLAYASLVKETVLADVLVEVRRFLLSLRYEIWEALDLRPG